MKESAKLISDACKGIRPERTPIFDLLLNDAVIEHFSGMKLDGTDDTKVSMAAIANALDGTRIVAIPAKAGTTWKDDLGNTRVAARWTSWIQEHGITDVEGWKTWIEGYIERTEAEPAPSDQDRMSTTIAEKALIDQLGGTEYIHCTPSTAINQALFGWCGLEMFSYLWSDYPDLVLRWLRTIERTNHNLIDLLAHRENCSLAMIYSDVAYKEKLMFSKGMMNTLGFFDDVASICDHCHSKGLQVIFHSDGYIMDIVPDLIAAGIDGLNPIEKAAGMDVYELRRKYPELILVGGVDVTHLLPYGTPEEVRSETHRIIRETGSEGRLLIGSSTELDNTVPLENYLAFHDEVMRGW
ncbi:MAG: uroporphyrinogen decarboxylase family protein [Armatimonadota bacterium]